LLTYVPSTHNLAWGNILRCGSFPDGGPPCHAADGGSGGGYVGCDHAAALPVIRGVEGAPAVKGAVGDAVDHFPGTPDAAHDGQVLRDRRAGGVERAVVAGIDACGVGAGNPHGGVVRVEARAGPVHVLGEVRGNGQVIVPGGVQVQEKVVLPPQS